VYSFLRDLEYVFTKTLIIKIFFERIKNIFVFLSEFKMINKERLDELGSRVYIDA